MSEIEVLRAELREAKRLQQSYHRQLGQCRVNLQFWYEDAMRESVRANRAEEAVRLGMEWLDSRPDKDLGDIATIMQMEAAITDRREE